MRYHSDTLVILPIFFCLLLPYHPLISLISPTYQPGSIFFPLQSKLYVLFALLFFYYILWSNRLRSIQLNTFLLWNPGCREKNTQLYMLVPVRLYALNCNWVLDVSCLLYQSSKFHTFCTLLKFLYHHFTSTLTFGSWTSLSLNK